MNTNFKKILTPVQIQDWDKFTMAHKPISSIQLMENAAQEFCYWFMGYYPFSDTNVLVICGTGNNGGDGFAIARILQERKYQVQIIHCQIHENWSTDCVINRSKAAELGIPIKDLRLEDRFPKLQDYEVTIDAIWGSGLNRPIENYWASWIAYLNEQPFNCIAVDVPSGLFSNTSTSTHAVLEATRTATFQTPKLAFFMAENQDRVGRWEVLDIGLSPDFLKTVTANYYIIEQKDIFPLLKKRGKHNHKGTFGHALLIAGSYGKIGAALLAAKAVLKIGAGLVTVQIPQCGYQTLQTAFPEAMVISDEQEHYFSHLKATGNYQSIGIGPGLGTMEATGQGLKELLAFAQQPIVLDADALNLLAQHPAWFELIPKNSILTPHPKEFERLFGKPDNDFHRLATLQEKAKTLSINIILKGAYTAIATAKGDVFFNTSGNVGMATAGTGDVLTGVLTGLLAQNYDPIDACIVGVFLHGLAGDLALEQESVESLIASDVISCLGKAYTKIKDEAAMEWWNS